jgi:hypothetical protein
VVATHVNWSEEFRTVNLIVESSEETRGVDAFALSLIKAERQIRRLVTHLIYQFPCFGPTDVVRLRETLGNNRRVYFEGFVHGFDALYSRSVRELLGAEHDRLRGRLDEAIDHRNKIFHGQLTSRYLTRENLLGYVIDIRSWCRILAEGALAEFRYDGFARNSFQKSQVPDLHTHFKVRILSIDTYADFIRQHMQRP